VAAQLCGDKKTVESLGYRVVEGGTVYDGDKPISKLAVCRRSKSESDGEWFSDAKSW